MTHKCCFDSDVILHILQANLTKAKACAKRASGDGLTTACKLPLNALDKFFIDQVLNIRYNEWLPRLLQ